MAERAVWRPRWYTWAGFGLGTLLLIHHSAPFLLHGHWAFFLAILLVALVLLVAALWELPVAGTMCAAIALTIFSGSWGSLGLPGFPFVPDRILLMVALLALALRAPAAAGLPRLRVRGVHLLLALTVMYATASAAAAGTLGTEAGVFDLLDRLGALPFLMLLIAPAVFASARARRMLLATLVALGGYLGITAIFEVVGPHALVFPNYIVAADALKPITQAGGPFQAPISDGFACFACGVAAAIAFRQWRTSRWRYAAGAVVAVSALGTFCSLERGVWIAAAAGALAAGLVARELRAWLVPAVVVCGVLIGGALVVFPALAGNATERAADQTPVWDRKNQTATAFRMIAAKPLFGFGWHNYAETSTAYFRQPDDYPMTGFSTSENPLPLHNSYLSNAVELGLVGLLLWLAALFWAMGSAILRPSPPELRLWKLGLLAIAVFFCVLAFFDPLQQNFAELLLWTWAGLCMAEVMPNEERLTARERSAPSPRPRFMQRATA
jgi:O-antigen ligase